MAKNDMLARQAYKRAVTDFLTAIDRINVGVEVAHGVGFWRGELRPILGRHLVKLATVELPEVKHGKGKGDPDCQSALVAVMAERDALAARLASIGKGERANVREARGDAAEGWQRYDAACRELAELRGMLEGSNPDPDPPEFDDCHITGEFDVVEVQ